jgi:hypothetical protein
MFALPYSQEVKMKDKFNCNRVLLRYKSNNRSAIYSVCIAPPEPVFMNANEIPIF